MTTSRWGERQPAADARNRFCCRTAVTCSLPSAPRRRRSPPGEEGFSYRYRGQAYRLLLPQAVIRGEAAGWHLSQVTALLPTRG